MAKRSAAASPNLLQPALVDVLASYGDMLHIGALWLVVYTSYIRLVLDGTDAGTVPADLSA